MKNELYEALIDGVTQGLTVTRFIAGISWLAAQLSDGGVGIAANLEGKICSDPTGKTAREAAQAVLSDDAKEACMGMAVINAYYNSVLRMEKFGCAVSDAAICTDGMDLSGKTVGIIGHMKRTADRLRGAKKVYIFELDPKDGDLPASEEARLLPECDVVIASGTTIANHTLPEIMSLSQSARIILLGPSVPMCEKLPGLERLCGSVVTKKSELMTWAAANAGSPFAYTQSYILNIGKRSG